VYYRFSKQQKFTIYRSCKKWQLNKLVNISLKRKCNLDTQQSSLYHLLALTIMKEVAGSCNITVTRC